MQEAVAGRLHERADVAVVITDWTYTQSAEELARTTSVILIHLNDIPSFKDMIRR
jgi:HJR/Mrr/RecB family endonuclease